MSVLFDLARKIRSSVKNARDTSESVSRDQIAKNTVPDIMGLPPEYAASMGTDAPNMNDVIRDSFPILEIIPCEPVFAKSLEMFTLTRAFKTKSDVGTSYIDELNKYYGYKLSGKAMNYEALRYAIQANSFPVMESFSNEVGESIFQSVADVGSSFARDFTFMTGTKTAGHGARQLAGLVDKMSGGTTGSDLLKSGTNKMNAMVKGLSNATGNRMSPENIKTSANIAIETIAGRAIDFPQVWRSSSWAPSYNANIRLYNPYPGDERATKEFIIGPLATLLMFVVPRTYNGYNFSWPWLCKYRVPGLYDVQAGFIKDVTVIRGGDDNHFALNSIPGMVDVRITLGTLYSNILGGDPKSMTGRGNPKLHQWLDIMTKTPNAKDDPPNNPGPKNWSNRQPGYAQNGEPETQGPAWKQTGYPNGFLDRAENILSQAAAIASVVPGVTQQTNEILNNRNEVPNRVSDYAKNQYSALKGLGG